MNLRKMIPIVMIIVLAVYATAACTGTAPAATTSPDDDIDTGDATLSITYSCGDGFVLAGGGKKVLTDILVEASRFLCVKDMESSVAFAAAQPPFDGIDLILASHTDIDHFPPQIIGNFLLNNPDTELAGSQTAVDALKAGFTEYDQITKQVHLVQPAEGQAEKITINGIVLEVINLPGLVPNLGFLFKLGGLMILESGDLGLEPDLPQLIATLQAYNLPGRQIDLAFVQWSYLTETSLQPILEEGIMAKNYVPMYFAGEDLQWALMAIPLSYPQAVIFQEELETWTTNPPQP